MLAFLHQNIRKRISQKFESYPHPEKLKNFLDKSAFSWICYSLANIVWTIYGIVHDEKPIIISNVANFFINVIVVIETFIY